MTQPEPTTMPLSDAVLSELRRIAFADMTDYVEFRTVKKRGTDEVRQEYTIKDSRKVDGAPLSELTVSKDGSLKVKMYDKMKALELLGRSAGLFAPSEDEPEPEPELSPTEALAVLRQAVRELPSFPAIHEHNKEAFECTQKSGA